MLIAAAAIIAGTYDIIEWLVSPTERPPSYMLVPLSGGILGAAFGIALRIIGKQLSGFGGVLFPRIRAFVASGPVIVAEMIGAAALWGMSAWFTFYLLDRIMHGPASDLGLDLILGIPFGVLIPLAAGFALYAASRIPNAPADANAPPPPEAVRMLGNAFTVFGIFWLLFAGSCTWTGGFNPSSTSLNDPEFIRNAVISFLFGSIAVAVGVSLRRLSLTSPRGS